MDINISNAETAERWRHSARGYARAFVKWIAISQPTGLACGALGTAFHMAVEYVTELRAAHWWMVWLLPLAGLAIVALYKLTKCEGVGTNNVLRAVQSGESVSLLLVPAIFIGTVLTHMFGGSAGREGAALQMGGSIGWNIGRALHLPDHDRRCAALCGMAAFFSALFGTPLAATLFAMMVMDVGLVFYAAFVPAFASSLIAYGVSVALGVEPTRFAAEIPAFTLASALRVAVLGVICAAAARLFCSMMHSGEHVLAKTWPNPWVRVVVGGLEVAVLTCGSSGIVDWGRYNGAGMDVIRAAIEQGQALPWDFICKIVVTAITLGAGFKGGEVVPSFYIGATLCCVIAPYLGLPAGFAAAVGLVAVFCGATNTLIPSIVLALELYGGGGLWYFAIACGVSYTLSGFHGLYSSQTFMTQKAAPEYFEAGWRTKHRRI